MLQDPNVTLHLHEELSQKDIAKLRKMYLCQDKFSWLNLVPFVGDLIGKTNLI